MIPADQAFSFDPISRMEAHELDAAISELVGHAVSPSTDPKDFCDLMERQGVAVYPTAPGDNTRGPSMWHSNPYTTPLTGFADRNMKVAGCRAILDRLRAGKK